RLSALVATLLVAPCGLSGGGSDQQKHGQERERRRQDLLHLGPSRWEGHDGEIHAHGPPTTRPEYRFRDSFHKLGRSLDTSPSAELRHPASLVPNGYGFLPGASGAGVVAPPAGGAGVPAGAAPAGGVGGGGGWFAWFLMNTSICAMVLSHSVTCSLASAFS